MECEALKKEINALKKTIKNQAPAQKMAEGGASEEDASDGSAESAAKVLAARIKDQRARIYKMEHADQDIKNAWGANSWAAKVGTERAELAALQQQNREAKPLDVQLKSALQHRSRCERQLEQAAEAVEQTMREQAELATTLAAFKSATREAAKSLESAEAECKRLQEWQAQPAMELATTPRAPDDDTGFFHVGPMSFIPEQAENARAVLDEMQGKVSAQLHSAFVYAVSQSCNTPPRAQSPASPVGGGEAAAVAGTLVTVDTAASLQQRKSIEAARNRESGRFAPA